MLRALMTVRRRWDSIYNEFGNMVLPSAPWPVRMFHPFRGIVELLPSPRTTPLLQTRHLKLQRSECKNAKMQDNMENEDEEDVVGGLPPVRENWWYGTTSYHILQTEPPPEPHGHRLHPTLNPTAPFVEIPVPSHVAVSPALAKLMRNVVPEGGKGQNFDDLFVVSEPVDVDDRAGLPVKVQYDLDLRPKSTTCQTGSDDESFNDSEESFCLLKDPLADGSLREGETPENTLVEDGQVTTRQLLHEVDTHLAHLRQRLDTLSSAQEGQRSQGQRPRYVRAPRLTCSSSAFQEGVDGVVEIRDFEAAVKAVTKAQPRLRARTVSKDRSRYPTLDPIDLLNQQILEKIDARDIVPLVKSGVSAPPVPRQVGGAQTAYIKRNTAPFRKIGRLREKSLPATAGRPGVGAGDMCGCKVISYGAGGRAGTQLDQEINYTTGLKPVDKAMQNYFRSRSGSISQGRVLSVPATKRKVSVPDSLTREIPSTFEPPTRIYEPAFRPDDPMASNYAATAQILAQLRADEAHLITLGRDIEGFRTGELLDRAIDLEASDALEQTTALLEEKRRQLQELLEYRRQLGIIESDV